MSSHCQGDLEPSYISSRVPWKGKPLRSNERQRNRTRESAGVPPRRLIAPLLVQGRGFSGHNKTELLVPSIRALLNEWTVFLVILSITTLVGIVVRRC